MLGPQIAKFTKQTGIKVNFQVIPWTTLLNQITAATVSGKGPTCSTSATPGPRRCRRPVPSLPFTPSVMSQIGGSSRFLAGSLSATGAPGQPPTAVPLYSLAYGLYYNKAQFAAAGISGPPTTWAQLIADGKKLTKGGHWGLAIEGGERRREHPHGVRAEPATGRPVLQLGRASRRSTPRRMWPRSSR